VCVFECIRDTNTEDKSYPDVAQCHFPPDLSELLGTYCGRKSYGTKL